MTTLYESLRNSGCELDSHCSDLYVKATAPALALVRESGLGFEFFRSALDGSQWLTVHFAYDPFWAERREAVTPKEPLNV